MIVSIGVAGFLVVRAGAGGCRAADPDVQPETPSGADPDYFPGPKADTRLVRPAPSGTSSAYRVYFPGSKADPHIVRPAPAPEPAGTALAVAPAPSPHFFPGSKAPAGDWADPDPPAGGGR